MNAQPRRQIGFYLITWAGMFVTASGGLSGRASDAAVHPTFDHATRAADCVADEIRPVLIGNVYDRADDPALDR